MYIHTHPHTHMCVHIYICTYKYKYTQRERYIYTVYIWIHISMIICTRMHRYLCAVLRTGWTLSVGSQHWRQLPAWLAQPTRRFKTSRRWGKFCVAVLPHYFLVFSIIFPTKLWQYHGVASILRHQIDQFGSGGDKCLPFDIFRIFRSPEGGSLTSCLKCSAELDNGKFRHARQRINIKTAAGSLESPK